MEQEVPAPTERVSVVRESSSSVSSDMSRDEATASLVRRDSLSGLDMKIMNLRTGKHHDVNFFIDPVEFLSVKTMENMHTYIWILKDLSWTQSWYWPGLVVGGIAMALSFVVTVGSVWNKEYADAWHHFAHLLWLVSNYIWMTGDFHDDRYPDAASVYDGRAEITKGVMIFALAWLGVYYLVLRPLNVFREKTDPYCRITAKSWVSRYIFLNWR